MNTKNLLDDIFKTSDDQVSTFMDALQGIIQEDRSRSPSDIEKIQSGKPDTILSAEQIVQVSGFIRVMRGWDGEDYYWHFAPATPKKPWKVSIDRVVYALAKVMSGWIPPSTPVKIWLPYADWEIKEVTFKAMGLKTLWNVTQRDVTQMSLKALEVLNTLV